MNQGGKRQACDLGIHTECQLSCLSARYSLEVQPPLFLQYAYYHVLCKNSTSTQSLFQLLVRKFILFIIPTHFGIRRAYNGNLSYNKITGKAGKKIQMVKWQERIKGITEGTVWRSINYWECSDHCDRLAWTRWCGPRLKTQLDPQPHIVHCCNLFVVLSALHITIMGGAPRLSVPRMFAMIGHICHLFSGEPGYVWLG